MICPVEIARDVPLFRRRVQETMAGMFSYTKAAMERAMKVTASHRVDRCRRRDPLRSRPFARKKAYNKGIAGGEWSAARGGHNACPRECRDGFFCPPRVVSCF